jgi:hypothetical protein
MSKWKSVLEAMKVLTGVSTQHNKALRDVKDWAVTIREFLYVYNLYGDYSLSSLSKNIGDVKFDLINITYKGRTLIKAARKIKGKQVAPLIEKLDDSLENFRRVLINPTLRGTRLNEAVLGLRMSFEELQDTLTDLDYM